MRPGAKHCRRRGDGCRDGWATKCEQRAACPAPTTMKHLPLALHKLHIQLHIHPTSSPELPGSAEAPALHKTHWAYRNITRPVAQGQLQGQLHKCHTRINNGKDYLPTINVKPQTKAYVKSCLVTCLNKPAGLHAHLGTSGYLGLAPLSYPTHKSCHHAAHTRGLSYLMSTASAAPLMPCIQYVCCVANSVLHTQQ